MATTRILVVDDEEDLCEILKFNLEIEGYEVDTAYSAEEALKKDLTVYNLLLLDVMMGEISGFKMARILRQDEKTANTPIIFLTAKDTENDMLTGFNLGADDYISKPFSIRQVIARVKAVLRRTSEKSKEKEMRAFFGTMAEYKIKEDGEIQITVPQISGPQFFGWLTAMGKDVHILKPKKTAAAYRDYLKTLAKEYKGV